MVIVLAFVYVLGLVLFVMFLVTRKFLRKRQGNTVSKTEKYLHGLNFMSFVWLFTIALVLSLMEFFGVITPIHMWPLFIGFLNEALSFSIFPVSMFTFFTIGILVAGYHQDPRESYAPVNAVGKRWLWALLVWLAILGIVGILTGILV